MRLAARSSTSRLGVAGAEKEVLLMSRLRLILMNLFAVLAVSAVASASASALQ